ncbi:MAG: hypothetical protein SGJ11_07535 [Phycisphaerae bacterium]|nr:hypothetical protein [Phycisphaerae bacterium]
MRIVLDDRLCECEASSIGAAVAAAADLAEREGRHIVDVFVDGQAWGDAELASAERLRGAADEVRVTSVRPGELVRETFLHAATALLEAEQLQRNAAKLMQADQSTEGFDALLAALGIWVNIHKATAQGVQFAQLDVLSVTTAEGTFDEAVTDLNMRLKSLRDAMQQNDSVAICDSLLYEFPLTTRRWASLLAELARRADATLKR